MSTPKGRKPAEALRKEDLHFHLQGGGDSIYAWFALWCVTPNCDAPMRVDQPKPAADAS